MTRTLIPLVNGCEEMEAVIIIDTLRRAKWDVVSVGLAEGVVTGSRKVCLVPDSMWNNVIPADFDLMVLPGGAEGSEQLVNEVRVLESIRAFHKEGKIVAAICAAPLVLQAAGILQNRRFTCHPGVAAQLTQGMHTHEQVVIDENIITSQGPGTALQFACTLIACIDGPEKANAIAKEMVHTLDRGSHKESEISS